MHYKNLLCTLTLVSVSFIFNTPNAIAQSKKISKTHHYRHAHAKAPKHNNGGHRQPLTKLLPSPKFLTSQNVLLRAEYAYTSGNMAQLNGLYNNYSGNPIISYLYAKATLNSDNPNITKQVITFLPDSFIRNDLLHQLLIYDMNHKEFNGYIDHYNELYNTQISLNEKCGFDLANLMSKNTKADSLTTTDELVNNDLPNWCIALVMQQYNQGNVNDEQLSLFLNNLALNGKLDNAKNAANRTNWDKSNHLITNNSRFNTLTTLTNMAKKNPEGALSKFNQSNLHLDKYTTGFIANYIAMQFARKQDFVNAKTLFTKYHTINLNNDEFEWKARVCLATRDWQRLINTVNDMPDNLRTKNVWVYWLSYAYNQLGKKEEAKFLLDSIPDDYSYYSMLAYSEFKGSVVFKRNPPASIKPGNDKIGKAINATFNLYQLAKDNGAKQLANIALFEWYYLGRIASNEQLIAMSNLAKNQEYYDLSIYAANQLDERYIDLSFPVPFEYYYDMYSTKLNLPVSYLLAISRQESRFNRNVIAFDGGMGLMQLMPQTAQYIQRKAKFSPCPPVSVQCNIELGSWYLGNLYNKFGSYIYSTAAYNAGPGRPNKWQDKLEHLDNRIQIELIPIAITRDYVQKVLTNKAIYDSKLSGSNQINLYNYILNIHQSSKDSNLLNDDNTDSSFR
jgi:soluble lytic murein transglycosylase